MKDDMDGQLIKVLLIEDNPGDARLLQELLREVTSVQFDVEEATCLSQGIELLDQHSFQVILLDLSLPDSQGLETFLDLYHQVRGVPIVVITGLNDETLALKAMQQGAQDYLVKGQVSSHLLVRSIRYAIERKRAEQKIREQAALLDIATDAILVRDLDNHILYWNKGAERLYGWSAEDTAGKKTSELLFKKVSPQFEAAVKDFIKNGEWQGELNQVTREGNDIVVESRWTLVREDNHQPKSILEVSTDITDKKKLEAQFFRAQRMESIGTLASGIAHDLNNILTPILATAQLLQIKLPNVDERSRQMFKTMEINAKRGAALVKQVLSFARGAEGKHTILQIKHLILETQQILKETFPKSIEIRADLPENLWTVFGDVTQLHQVLMNLCVNAHDAMPNGGILSISAENLIIDEHYARMNLDAKVGAYIVITVSDNGIGISPEILDRIYEPFFTTKEVGKGTGLGLSTVVGIVRSHHGFINVNSTLGKGTQFRLFLPAVNAVEESDSEDLHVPMGNGELILLVDDESAVRDVSKTSLEAYNYQVITACDGIEAIALYAQNQDEIRLVLVDMMMPSMDGYATIRALQRINSDVKIIAVSGLVSASNLITTEGGIQSFLPKPYTAKDLVKAVNVALKVELSTL